ncbi:MAG: hypothetical protein ACP5N1_03925 [Candidatus Woesearchaeota archaeon]
MIAVAEKHVASLIPTGLLMDLSYLYKFTDTFYSNRDIDLVIYDHLMMLESEKILLAKYPKNSKLDEGIIVDPRYANEKDFDFFEVKGFRRGRTIDILTPTSTFINGEDYPMINIKGVGAFADKKFMVLDSELWYLHNKNEWKPFHEVMNISLGRRWGILDSYSGEKEFTNNLFFDNGIAQSPHIKFNKISENILPFEGITQLVRGLKTNIRCNELNSKYFQENYINPEKFSVIDAKVFAFQKELYTSNRELKMFGTAADNRYIDGNFTDMENISISPQFDEKEKLQNAYKLIKEIMGSVFQVMGEYEDGRKIYLQQLEEKTGIMMSKYLSLDPKLFMRKYIPKEVYENKYALALSDFRTNIIKDLIEYFKN